MKNVFLLGTTLLLVVLTGCATQPSKGLYSWGSYQEQTYLSLSASEKATPQDQVLKFEKEIEKARGSNSAVAPGVYAHLALQYLNMNDTQKAIQYFQLERQVYPESTVMMDRILAKITGQKTAGVKK